MKDNNDKNPNRVHYECEECGGDVVYTGRSRNMAELDGPVWVEYENKCDYCGLVYWLSSKYPRES